jgi:hypothetical protein
MPIERSSAILNQALRGATIVLSACALLCGCGQKRLTEASVRKFVDAADEAFTRGNADAICSARSDDFVLTATEFALAGERIVLNVAEAEKIAAERQDAHELIEGKNVHLNSREFCAMAYQSRAYFRRATLLRGPLQITLDPSGIRATVRAHYTVKEPVEAYRDSPLSYKDSTEHQVATKQTESDDESLVILDKAGEMKFASTKSVSKWFRIPSERDSRL